LEVGGVDNETLAHDVPLSRLGTKFGGTAALKFGRAKDEENLARFRKPFNFEHKYLWKG